MADHKRQHFVPKCYLRRFSPDDNGRSVNLYNIDADRFIPRASIKGQCAKDYFYGHDLELENALHALETKYASTVQSLSDPNFRPSDQGLFLLRLFAFLQYGRTDMAIRRLRKMHEGMHQAIYEGRRVEPKNIDLSDQFLMLESMRLYLEMRETISDLKICIARNLTNKNFITSDDPSIFTSRFYVQRLQQSNFGFGSSGATFFLPISPRLLLVCYDSGVYHIPSAYRAYADIKREEDVNAINELQYLKGSDNIYFQNWDDRRWIARDFRSVAEYRQKSWSSLSVMVPEEDGPTFTKYRTATEHERTTAEHTLIALSSEQLRPQSWASFLKFRAKPQTYSDGSAAGHVRKKIWNERHSEL